jgi:hypothetical protein
VTSGANQTAGVPARATVGVRGRHDCSQISSPAHREFRSARWSHPTDRERTLRERELIAQHLESLPDVRTGLFDLQFSLLNSNEFLLRH